MITLVLILHIVIAVALVGVVLLQRSEGGALGIGGNPGGGIMSGRGAASALTRTTAVLATAFIATSIVLALLASGDNKNRSIFDDEEPIIQENSDKIDKKSSPSVPIND
ncbi:MAG: preprotein translocase subunit SecG [Rhodospirillaceae bacterium]|mgnify:CR=1 FL=1|nr:preprotein translocase subunit SecG [Rhodospirillaceae bacterium]|tara:strand:- start:68 stop:394 length:327 start_codon:yes stop_codon:yes gene_type:complete